MTEKTYAQFTADNGETVMVSPVYQVAVEQIVAYRKQEWEKELREQIAREIEICEPCFNDVWCGKDEKNQDCSCICHQYATIARGEK